MTGSGKRSRNPSTSSGYGVRLGGYRSRRASEGDEGGPGGPGSRRGGGSRGGSRHNSGGGGGVSKPYRGRHSDESNSWVISSSYQVSVPLPLSALSQLVLVQEKIRLRQAAAEVGRKNPSGPRKRANSASDKVVTVTKVDKFEVEQ